MNHLTWIYGHWHRMEALIGAALFFLGMLLVPWERFMHTELDAKLKPVQSRIAKFLTRHPYIARFSIRLAITIWTTVILGSFSIWIDSTWHHYGQSWAGAFLCILYPTLIVTLTFTLEGMETAFTELRDKDRQQLAGMPAAGILDYIRSMGEENFFDAREWAIIVLLVWATLLIEQEKYYLPFMGVVEASDKIWHDAVRIILTIALTAFALVWVAQSPSKFVARKNSAAFLSYFTRFILRFLSLVWDVLRGVGLGCPSQIADKLTLKMMSRCQEKRALLPSDLTFFADGLKKYGYGFLISDDIMTVDKEGAITLTSRTLHYVGDVRESVKRRFLLEKGYVCGLKEAIEAKNPHFYKCQAIEGPPIGERADQPLIDLWGRIFYSPAAEWKLPPGYEPYPTTGFVPQVDIRKSTDPPDPDQLFMCEVEVRFNEPLPRRNAKRGEDEGTPRSQSYSGERALLILMETSVRTRSKAVRLPVDENITTYSYFKKHFQPCLRSSFIVHLPQTKSKDLAGDIVFARQIGPENFTVKYDGITHVTEQARFWKQKREPPFHPDIEGAPKPIQTPGLSQTFVCFMDSSLPAAEYKINLKMMRLRKGEGVLARAGTTLADVAVAAATNTAIAPATDATVAAATELDDKRRKI